MAIPIDTLEELVAKLITAFNQTVNAGQSDPTKQVDANIKNSFSRGVVVANAAGFDENFDAIRTLEKQIFLQSAEGEYLDQALKQYGIVRIQESPAQGLVSFSGTPTTPVAQGTLLTRADGIVYATTIEGTISSQSISVTSLSRVGVIATAVTVSDHNLASGNTVTITGTIEPEYNVVSAIINVVDVDTFTYTVAGSPTTPATGPSLASFDTASIQVVAQSNGLTTNSAGGTELTLVSSTPGINDNAYVGFLELEKGLDTEKDDEVRARGLERTSVFGAPYTEAGLPIFIKNRNPGVTRVWTKTAFPAPGSTTMYFTRDGDPSNIPSSSEVTEVKNSIIDPLTGIKPPHTAQSNVIVLAPTPITVDFTFSSLSPNTPNMREAITLSLTDFFRNGTELETNLLEAAYNSVIFTSLDSQGNTPLFSLTIPSGDVSVTAGELAVLGTITFP